MRVRSAAVVLVLLSIVGLSGCGSKGSKSSSRATAAGISTATTSPTTTQTGTGAGQVGGGVATGSGGNTSSGGANTGSTPAGYAGGTGRFIDGSSLLPDTQARDVGAEAADFDGDGDVDIAFAVAGLNGAGNPSRVVFNEGNRFAERPGAFPALAMQASDVRAVDVDGDRDLDLIYTANYEPARVFKNNGQGVFTLTGQFNVGNDCLTYNAALGDVDGDGDQDVFLANAGQTTPSRGQNKLFLNDGTGMFTEAPSGSLPVKYDDSIDATFLDVDGDRDLDIFVANFGTTHSLLVNQGGARFLNQADVWLPPALTRYGTAIGQGDLNRDGKIDLYVCNEGPSINGAPPAGERNTLLLQATGKFDDYTAQIPSEAEASFAVRLVDVNGDGWQDVLVSNLRAVQRLYLNQQGTLVDASANLPAVNNLAYDSLGLTIGDFNGDRAPDVLFTRRGYKPWLFLNIP